MQTCVEQVAHGEAERVDRGVRDADGADELRIHRRLDATGLLGVDDVGTDAGALAGLYKGLLVLQVVLGQGDEQSVGLLNAVAGNAAQNHVLADALGCALAVGHGIAGAAVHQAVVATRGPRAIVIALDQQHAQAAQRAIPRRSGTRSAATDDDHVIFLVVDVVCYHKHSFLGSKTNSVN